MIIWSYDDHMITYDHMMIRRFVWFYVSTLGSETETPGTGKVRTLENRVFQREKDQNNHDIQNCFFQTLVVFRTGYWPMVKERKIWPTAFQRAICFQIEKIGFTNLKEEKMTLTTCRFPNQEQSCTPRLNWDTCVFCYKLKSIKKWIG